ncbi:hypothetical protein N1E68_28420, partial [Pseudomonas aeruginosa]|nr:hypothetical protein [Pseudomonas aeruginosa]MCS9417093.1 hypothetical protein [Pseudomonas aeruginosa]
MNLIDRLLEPLAPELVARRLAAREAIQAYEAARPGRTHKAKRQPLGADTSLQKSAVSMREQCRKLDVRIPRHSDTQPTLIRTPVPRSFGQAV